MKYTDFSSHDRELAALQFFRPRIVVPFQNMRTAFFYIDTQLSTRWDKFINGSTHWKIDRTYERENVRRTSDGQKWTQHAHAHYCFGLFAVAQIIWKDGSIVVHLATDSVREELAFVVFRSERVKTVHCR